jgi:uncharacterized UBP type Zn finger protein
MIRLRRRPAAQPSCDHVSPTLPSPQAGRCQECGSDSRLRLCARCGHVGCCESQAGHARSHALTEGHPVVHELPTPGGFTWCYVDAAYIAEPVPREA